MVQPNVYFEQGNDMFNSRLNTFQEQIVERALQKHNCCILGAPGTDKSTLSIEIVEALEHKGLNVMVTGTTGMSASALSGGKTVHSAFGAFRWSKFSDVEMLCCSDIQH